MSAQLEGLKALVGICRKIIAPQLEFIVLVYTPKGDLKMSSVMHANEKQTPTQQLERAREAATEFLNRKPDPEFNAHKN